MCVSKTCHHNSFIARYIVLSISCWQRFIYENQSNSSVTWIIDNYCCRHQYSSNIKVVWVFFFGWAANLQRSARMPWGPPARRWHTWWMRWIEVMLTRAPCMQRIPFQSHLWTLITSAPDVSNLIFFYRYSTFFFRKIILSSRLSRRTSKRKGMLSRNIHMLSLGDVWPIL